MTNNSKYNLWISIALIIIFIIGIYFLTRPKTNTPPSTPTPAATTPSGTTTAPKALIDKSLVTEVKYNTPDTYATFDVTYPQFKNASDIFNGMIKNDVDDAIAQHKKDSAANWQARYKNKLPGETTPQFPTASDKYTLNISWQPIQVNSQYISAVIIYAGYTGGAHGYSNTVSYNFDVKNQKEVELTDLFPVGSNYLKTLSDFSRTNLEAQFRKSLAVKTADDEKNFQDGIIPMLLDGTTPQPANFQTFTFTPSIITIYFAQYQVGPYVMGEPKVNYPRK